MATTSVEVRTNINAQAIRGWCASFQQELVGAPITLLVVFASVLAFFSGGLTSAWQLEQIDSASSCWRLLTCHLTHWSFDQLFWDLLAFAVLGYLCEQTGRRRMLGVLLLSSIAVSASVVLLHPNVATYRGLSGVDSALFAYLACWVAEAGFKSRDPRWLLAGGAAWLSFASKVGFEHFVGQTWFVETSGVFQSLPLSHAAGALSGSFVWLMATVGGRGSKADRRP